LGDKGVDEEVRDRGEIVRLGMQRTVVSMTLKIGLEPVFGVERLRLR
jgi:hypothetical protein